MIRIIRDQEGVLNLFVLEVEPFTLGELPDRLQRLLERPDFSTRVMERLFPQAYRDDAEAEEEYRDLLRSDILRNKLEAVETFRRTLEASERVDMGFGAVVAVRLREEELALWVGFLHDIRVVIGTALDITDDDWSFHIPDDGPESDEWRLLEWLTVLEGELLEALARSDPLEGPSRRDG